MGVFKSIQRRRWKLAVNGEFRRSHGVDLRTVGDMIGATTLRNLLDDEFELAPHSPVLGARNVTQMLAHVHRVDIASLAPRDRALTMPPARRDAGRPASREARGGRAARAGAAPPRGS